MFTIKRWLLLWSLCKWSNLVETVRSHSCWMEASKMQLNQIKSTLFTKHLSYKHGAQSASQSKIKTTQTERKYRQDQTAVSGNVGVRSKSYIDEASQTITTERQQSDKSDTVSRKIQKTKKLYVIKLMSNLQQGTNNSEFPLSQLSSQQRRGVRESGEIAVTQWGNELKQTGLQAYAAYSTLAGKTAQMRNLHHSDLLRLLLLLFLIVWRRTSVTDA